MKLRGIVLAIALISRWSLKCVFGSWQTEAILANDSPSFDCANPEFHLAIAPGLMRQQMLQ
ncbi:MAG: hypothetical protein F6K28_21670 [Microcoleus sp. SIO2G3]|nr:hypothetical protein [Microcoleus sp. SIO2G3]